MKDNREYIICAAIKRINPKDCVKHYYNNDIYDIEIGYRHCDIFARFEGEVSEHDQGFYTSKGRFVDRYEGMYIAWIAGQVSYETALKKELSFENLRKIIENKEYIKECFNKLYSEDLY
jgi:hypothetical protein